MVTPVKIVVIDYYLSTPIPELDVTYSEFRGSSVSQVPILRCFGCDENGNKICVHIHGVFPYLYIPYDGNEKIETFMYQLALSIDKAINVSLNQASSSTQHVYKICLVSGIPMYGYHSKKHQFLKIYLYNPMLVTTLSNLLINKSILGRIYQPHEAHINYTLQFMIDYNLHGMSKMLITHIKYRGNHKVIAAYNLPPNIEKITICELEGDIDASNILNREEIINGKLTKNPGIAVLWEEEKQRLRNKNEKSQMGDFLELSNIDIEPTKTHFIFKQALVERLAVLSIDKETSKTDLDLSVYPAESPLDVSVKNASIIDIHTPSSLELSFESLDQSLSILDYTMTQENLNMTVSEDAQIFLQVLEDLAEEKENKELEQDSILSQQMNEEQIDDLHEDDLSKSLVSITESQAIITDMNEHSCSDEDQLIDKTIIPQIDGNWDLSQVDCNKDQIIASTNRQTCEYYKNHNENKSAKTGIQIKDISNCTALKRYIVTCKKSASKPKHCNSKTRKRASGTKSTILKSRYDIFQKNCDSIYKKKNVMSNTKYHSILHKTIKLNSLLEFNLINSKQYTGNTYNLPIYDRTYLNCDGTADNSSDDEDLNVKKLSKNKPSKYLPLNISVAQSPKLLQKSSNEDIDQSFQGDQSISISNNQMLGQLGSHTTNKDFNSTFLGDHTFTEQHMACTYSPRQRVTEKLEQLTKKKTVLEKNLTNNSDSDIFSEEENCKTFFEKPDLVTSISAKYNNSYSAKQGCSFVCRPNNVTDIKSTIINQHIPPLGEVSNIKIQFNCEPFQKNKEMAPYITSLPKVKVPSKDNIEMFLSEKKISLLKCQVPFYSDVKDYNGATEVGQRTLRIASKCSIHLPEFETEFDNLNCYRKRFANQSNLTLISNSNTKNMKLTQCSNHSVVLKPLKKLPSVFEIKKQLKDIKNVKEYSPKFHEEQFEQSKQFMCNYSGYDDNEGSDSSLSLSSCTPLSPDVYAFTSEKCQNVQDLTAETNKSCQITGVTQPNSFGFNNSILDFQAARAVTEHQYLTTMVMEMHIRTRGYLKPDPEYDAICAIFYSVLNDVPETQAKKSRAKGIIALKNLPLTSNQKNDQLINIIKENCDIYYADTEEALISSFLDIIKFWDPDILTGYEIQMLSWGYLVDRGFALSLNLIPLLGRSQINKYGKNKTKPSKYELECDITGRIVLDAWRLMRHEIALQSYTFESIVYHILHRRVPQFSFRQLSIWWDYKTNHFRHRVINYYLLRVDTILELFQKLDFINKTSELAKLFGIMFYEVLSRGSQFRVESMMLRLAKPLNYVSVSPNSNQRAHMKAPEFVPLIMEPESTLYSDPVIVLDFQSLYPSIIIAYNYCYTTCLGRVCNLGTNSAFEFGSTQLKVPKKLIQKLSKRDLLNFAPCGVAYVKKQVREGILPRMLKEILNTRLMLKNVMKQNKGNESLQKVLHNRQLGLKLIANVTFGYTAASFSGRMSCVEIMDSILSKARETLQRAIAMVENTPEWGGKVVYGDTDSLFVMVPGKTKEQAFEIGKNIAEAITNDNPDPVKLKLEKIYQPCILQTKKRYVGYMYESAEQVEPIYEAKGIETVRRDGCPAVSKILQKCLTLLFDTSDVSTIKKYVLRQFHKILVGRVSIQDLTFAKEYRGASGYKPGACVPALELSKKWRVIDRRGEPRNGERVPYVIINGAPGLPLIHLVRSPRDLLNDPSLKPNALYYITKVIIPPLNRCLSLIGADVNTWFNQMPRRVTQYLPNSSPTMKKTISQYFSTALCACCSQQTQDGLCINCYKSPANTTIILTEKLQQWEKNYHNTKLLCHYCTNHQEEVACVSLDCPILYRRYQAYTDLQQAVYVRELLNSAFSDMYF